MRSPSHWTHIGVIEKTFANVAVLSRHHLPGMFNVIFHGSSNDIKPEAEEWAPNRTSRKNLHDARQQQTRARTQRRSFPSTRVGINRSSWHPHRSKSLRLGEQRERISPDVPANFGLVMMGAAFRTVFLKVLRRAVPTRPDVPDVRIATRKADGI